MRNHFCSPLVYTVFLSVLVGCDVNRDARERPAPPIPWNTAISYGTLKDTRDGRSYRTVEIGARVWMAENLNYAGSDSSVGMCYDNSADSCAKYGRQYTWEETMDGTPSSTAIPSGVQGVCPSGWHVPSDTEWTTMEASVEPTNTTDGNLLKSATGWVPNGTVSGNGSDVFGFRALPGGCFCLGANLNAAAVGYWWSATDVDGYYAVGRDMDVYHAYVYHDRRLQKDYSLSLRCTLD